MKTYPTFTIVTPSFNQAQYIEQTIQSILDQKGNFYIQYIVADAGSTDGSAEIIKKYAELIKTKKYPVQCQGITMEWWSKPDKGQSDAINQGLLKATGEYIAYLNTDDYYFPGTLEAVSKNFSKYPNAGMLYSDFVDVDSNGKTLQEHKLPEFDLQHVVNGNIIPQPATFVRKEVVERVGILNPDYHYAMDYDWWVRIGKQFPVKHIDGCWAAFRLHGDSKTVALAKNFWKEERHISRSNGGKFFSRQYIHHMYSNYPTLTGPLLKLRSLFKRAGDDGSSSELRELNQKVAESSQAAPSLAVIIPTVNRQDYTIKTALQALGDSYKDLEVIVVDQSSELTKDTLEFLKKNRDPRLRFFHVNPVSGVAAKNFALRQARANIVLFLDDDVELDASCITEHVAAYSKHPGIGGVGGRVKQDGIPITKTLLRFDKYGISGYRSFNYLKAEYTDTVAGGNMSVFRIEALRVGGFDTNFLRSQHREESEFSARYFRAGNTFYFEPKASLTHLAAHYGGTRHKGDFADFPDYYKNNLYFVLRYCRLRDLPVALIKQLRFYCLRKKPLTTIRRCLLFAWGLLVAVRRIIVPHRTVLKLIKEYSYE